MNAESVAPITEQAQPQSLYERAHDMAAAAWQRLGRVAAASLLLTGSTLIASTVEDAVSAGPAMAAGERAAIGMPFNGKWAYSGLTSAECGSASSQTSHPSCHEIYFGDWSTDLYGPAGTEVKLRASSSGDLAFSWDTNASGTCGETRGINVLVDGVSIGRVHYAHLSGAASTASAPREGMVIGKIANLNCNPGGDGKHIHMEFDNNGSSTHSCYNNYSTANSTAGVTVPEGAGIGVLGSSNADIKQSCSAAAEGPNNSVTLARPAVTVHNGALNVFIRGGDGQIYNQYWNGTSWTGYAAIGGNMRSDPAVIVNGNALNVFAIGADGQVYTQHNAGSGWSGWSSMGATTMKGNPRVMRYGGELNIFALGTDSHPYKNTWQSTNGWSGWISMGNYMDSSPMPVQYGSELDVIMRGGDCAVYKNTWDGNRWSGFGSLGPCLAGNPDAIAYGGQLDIWANAASGHIWKRTWNGSGWGAWTDMGGNYAGDPDVMQYNADLEVFVRGTNGQMYTRYWSAVGQYWSSWVSLGGNIAGEPTAVQYGQELSVFATGKDGKTYKNTFQPASGWGGFTTLPG